MAPTTVILTALNGAWAEPNTMIDLFWRASEFVKTRGVDFSAEKVYMSNDYLEMMWTRLGFLGDILRRGYSLVFSDADIM